MELCGVCIYTNDAPRLASFYTKVLREEPTVAGEHYGFDHAQLAVYNPGGVNVTPDKNMSLMFFVDDVKAEYERLLKEIPEVTITLPLGIRPWGAYSFWFLDLDGNTISFIEKTR